MLHAEWRNQRNAQQNEIDASVVAKAEFELSDGRSLSIIDYQTPLKARQTDKGVGKIDLFGVIDKTIPTVMELKIHGQDGSKADTPLRALLEGLAYCAIIEANLSDIKEEVRSQHHFELTQPRPDLIVLAPKPYWDYYLNKPSAGDWLPVFENLIDQLHEMLDLQVQLISLINADFEMGSKDIKPRLIDNCRMDSVVKE